MFLVIKVNIAKQQYDSAMIKFFYTHKFWFGSLIYLMENFKKPTKIKHLH